MTTRVVVLGLIVVLGGFAARCLQAARANSVTMDEPIYVSAALRFWMTGDDPDLWRLGVPRLPHLINALVPYLVLRRAGRLPAPGLDSSQFFLRLLDDDMRAVFRLARQVAIGWGLLALLVVYWAVARWGGAARGLAAVAVLSMVPEMLAHSSVAGSDMPAAAAMFIALIALARYVERRSLSRWMTLALSIGLAWAMKHTAVLILPLAVVVDLWVVLRRARPSGRLAVARCLAGPACTGGALVLVAFLMLWAADGLRMVPDNPLPLQLRPPDISKLRRVSRLPRPTSLQSLDFQINHAEQGHPAYFCGRKAHRGWTLYFPVAFLLKTPIGLLILIVLALVRVRPRGAWDGILLACLVLLWMALEYSKVNIGLRYALLTYALIVPFIARLFEPAMLRDRIWGPVTIAAALLLAWESTSCHPRYLSSFNRIGGGSRLGWLYLADSNIDWGQDMDALAAELGDLGIEEITYGAWGTWKVPTFPGIRIESLGAKAYDETVGDPTPPARRLYFASELAYHTVPTRYVVTSVCSMLGVYQRDDHRWLWTRRLVKRVNDSLFIFDMDRPAETPFVP